MTASILIEELRQERERLHAQVDTLQWSHDVLSDLVRLHQEREAIGGGPGYTERLAKAWANAEEIFEP